MRGLTAEEYAHLRYMNSPHIPQIHTDEKQALALDLEEQGRIVASWAPPYEHDGVWIITPSGREALRLWPAIKAAPDGAR